MSTALNYYHLAHASDTHFCAYRIIKPPFICFPDVQNYRRIPCLFVIIGTCVQSPCALSQRQQVCPLYLNVGSLFQSHTHTQTHTYTDTQTHRNTHTYIQTCTHTYIHIYIYVCMYVYIYIVYIYIYIYIYI